MNSESNSTNGRSLLSFLQKRKAWQEVVGYHVGDIHSPETAVLVDNGSTVVGNIYAPEVVIAGLLCGSVVCERAEIRAAGQVWGDLFTVAFSLAEGGKVQGWVGTIERETAVLWIEQGEIPEEKSTGQHATIPREIIDQLPKSSNEQDIAAYQFLQSEIATALAARAEIEHRFESRINEVAGGASEKIEQLNQQLTQSNEERRTNQTKLKEATQQLQQKEKQLEHHQSELAMTRQTIAEQQQAQQQLEETHTQLDEQHTILAHDKQVLEENLTEAQENIARLKQRLKSAEEALKGSLQHSSELQDSLERWQELAETNEKEAHSIQQQLDQTQFKLNENDKMLEILREQKKQAEEEWLQTQTAYEQLRVATGASTDESAAELFIDEAGKQMAQLEETLLELMQQREEENGWFLLNLHHQAEQIGAISVEVEALAEENEAQFLKIAQYETELADKAAQIEQLEEQAVAQENEVVRLTAVFQTHQTELETKIAELETSKQALENAKNQQEATEADLQYHLDAIEKQGKHLAEIQERLVERELQLKQAGQIIKQQKAVYKEFKAKATSRIKQLQEKHKQASST